MNPGISGTAKPIKPRTMQTLPTMASITLKIMMFTAIFLQSLIYR
jgi:hypothetical protein